MSDLLAPAANLIVPDVGQVEAALPGMHVTRLDRGREQAELTLVELGNIGLCVGRFDDRTVTWRVLRDEYPE